MDDPLYATTEEFAAEGFTHVQYYCARCRASRLRPISWLPRISMGLTIAQLSARVRCAECGGQLHSVPWMLRARYAVSVAIITSAALGRLRSVQLTMQLVL